MSEFGTIKQIDAGALNVGYAEVGPTVEVELCGLPNGARVWQANLIEDHLSQLDIRDGVVRLVFHPWPVQTVRVEHRQETG